MTIETQSNVAAVAKPEDTNGEPGMLEYAQLRAEGKPIVPAAATEDEDTAAATGQDSAAAADDTDKDGKKPTESATADDATTTETTETPAKKPSKGIEKRFSELTKQREEAKAEAEAHRKAAEAAQAQAAQAVAEANRLRALAYEAAKAAVPTVPSAAEDPIPVRANFDDPDEFTAAVSAHAARNEIRKAAELAQQAAQRRAEEASQAAQQAQAAQQQALMNNINSKFLERQTKAMEDLPDYADKVVNNDKMNLHPYAFFDAIQDDMGPQILYHLATHPEEADKLSQMHTTGQSLAARVRLGELKAEIKAESKPRVTKAAPVTKSLGSRSSPGQKTPDEMSMEEYAATRNSQFRDRWAQDHPRRTQRK